MTILSDIRKKKGVTQRDLAEALGVPLSTYRAWEYGINDPKSDNLVKLADFLDVTVDDLLGRSETVYDPTSTLIPMNQKLPLFGTIPAGKPMEMWEIIDELPAPPGFVDNGKSYFYLKVNGDSMDQVILDGHIALIEKRAEARNGEAAVVVINGFDATLKLWYKTANSLILSPASHNTTHEDIIFRDSDEGNPEVKVLGVMVWQMGPLG